MTGREGLVDIGTASPVWDRFFLVSPLVLVGTLDADGGIDLAPKHMAMPLGWRNFFGFVCSREHGTCANISRTGEFTVSYPKPSEVLFTSLAASPRLASGDKPVLAAFDTFPARTVDAHFVADAYLYFECRHHRTIDGFGDNCLVTGEIVAACVDSDYLRTTEVDDQEMIHDAPLLAYLQPGRFASIDRSYSFPFPADMKK